ncbi:MAG: GTP-binding protein [Promethearchaeota archaeon]
MGTYHNTKDILELMTNLERLRNVGLVGHVDHGKTTLSDSLLAEAGLLSEKLAGEARALDYLEEEQRRGITMKSANVSLYYEHGYSENDKTPFLINLVDTPGHLDFSGKVTRALRLIDGVIIIVDAVEEINSQSETVIRQALEEAVRPILFINKIDRLYRELRLDDNEIKEKLGRIINRFNKLIDIFSDKDYKKKWKVSAEEGTVIFGSALHKWGFTMEEIIKKKMSFKDIREKYEDDEWSDLKSIFPVWEAVLSAMIKHLPNPLEAQKYRIHEIWGGDLDSEIGKAMINCDTNGPLIMCMSNIKYDSHGLIATGRIFAGKVRKGQKVYLIDADREERVQKVAIYMGARMDNAEEIPAGNIAAITGLKYVKSGETVIDASVIKKSKNIASFENVKYVSDPVITIAIEPEFLKDINIIHEELDKLLIEDPNLQYKISEDTGEILLSGMGPLHLEVAIHNLEEKGIKITTSEPMSVFRESVKGRSELITAIQKRNDEGTEDIIIEKTATLKEVHELNIDKSRLIKKISLIIERTDLKTVNALQKIKLTGRSNYKDIILQLKEEAGLTEKEANGYMYSDKFGNIVINAVKNLIIDKYSGRKIEKQKYKLKKSAKGKRIEKSKMYIKEAVVNDFIDSLKTIFLSGPLCRERMAELKITILDIFLPENIDEGELSEITPLLREAIFAAIESAGPVLLEPIYQILIQIPSEQLGAITNLLNLHQAKIEQIKQSEFYTEISGYISVRDYIEFSKEVRSATSGKAFWQTQFHSFEEVPSNQQLSIINSIRFRKGLI